MKTKKFSRLISILLSFAMLCTVAVQGISTVSADSVYENENLLTDPGFENMALANSPGVGHWSQYNSVTRTTEQAHSGSYSIAVTHHNSGSSCEQDISGLQVGATYIFSIWAKRSAADSNANPQIGVKNFGGEEIKVDITSTEWKQYSVEFRYTSSAQNPRVYMWVANGGAITTYADDASLTVKSDIARAEISNGTIDVDFSSSYTGTPSAEAFSANYTTSADADNVKPLALAGTIKDGGITLNFDEIEALPVEQTITVNLTYGAQTIQLDYKVAAAEGELVTANIESLTAENGRITAVLTENPTIAPVLSDFSFSASVNGASYPITVSEFSYNSATKTVTFDFSNIGALPETDRNVTVTVTYNGAEKQASFVVEHGTATVYYVSNSGSDSNNGTSEETPFATIARLNRITFNPGDKILLKKGDTFVGTFTPQGSGIDGAPITISSYGAGNTRPVLQPGDVWTINAMTSGDSVQRNAQLKGCIYLYNVEYWDINGLELCDPSYDPDFYAVNSLTVYNAAIRVANMNMGDLTHFWFDDLVIHGFRGPGSNLGKTSGGIQYNTYIDPDNASVNVPSAIVDMRVTNCIIYECGRSGINFLNPWSLRRGTDEKWYATSYGTRTFYPHRDFYMANCLIHDIDGDGLIVDNVSNAVVEHNLCYKTAIHLGSMGAAVGFFNWNSDDTYFQFNEVYSIGVGATQNNGALVVPGDAQAIEVDALNDRTWVQYNYVHDNAGGLMMWCNVSSDAYAGYDAIIRYNISERDAAAHGIFNCCGFDYGSEFYNNVIYLNESALNSNGQIYMFSGATSAGIIKFYNNIFYYDGAQAAAASSFANDDMDWRSNIFYGFTNLPVNDDEENPNIIADPLFKNVNCGVAGTVPGEICDLTGYTVSSDSPAINAGVPLASMKDETGRRDYFGNPLSGIPDIGVYESGTIADKLVSTEYAVNQTEKTVTTDDTVTVGKLMSSLVYETELKVSVLRNDIMLTDGVYLATGDIIKAEGKNVELVYTIEVTETEESNIIPVERLTATAGSEEISQSRDVASNVLDGKTASLWHTAWNGADRSLHYITLKIADDYRYNVEGLTCLPRQSGSNGIITQYRIEVSSNGTDWTTATSGTWSASDTSLKTVEFDGGEVKYVKLVSVASTASFSSIAEMRLLGTRIIDESDAPVAPQNASASEISGVCAKLEWEASDDESVTKYIIKNGDDIIGAVSADTLSFIVGGLEKNTEYTFTLHAQNGDGILSESTAVKFTTTDSDKLIQPIINLLGDVNNDGKINAADAVLVLQKFAGIISDDELNIISANVNGDEAVNATDAALILQRFANIIESFPAKAR